MSDFNLELSPDITRNKTSTIAIRRVAYFLLPMLVIVGALIAYKSSAALTVIGKVSATGVFTPQLILSWTVKIFKVKCHGAARQPVDLLLIFIM